MSIKYSNEIVEWFSKAELEDDEKEPYKMINFYIKCPSETLENTLSLISQSYEKIVVKKDFNSSGRTENFKSKF